MRIAIMHRSARWLLLATALTLGACLPTPGDNDHVASSANATASGDADTGMTESDSRIATTDLVRLRVASALAREQYGQILEWLRREGLQGKSAADLAAVAATQPAAARYIDCHESTKAPTAEASRLGMLSACLLQDDSVAGAESVATDGMVVAHQNTESPVRID